MSKISQNQKKATRFWGAQKTQLVFAPAAPAPSTGLGQSL